VRGLDASMIHLGIVGDSDPMSILSMLESESAAEKCIVKAFLYFEKGDEPNAVTNLLTGLEDLAGPGTKVGADIAKLLAKLVAAGFATAPKIPTAANPKNTVPMAGLALSTAPPVATAAPPT
jgi:hypothetical protein